jgi:hypothetical protein
MWTSPTDKTCEVLETSQVWIQLIVFDDRKWSVSSCPSSGTSTERNGACGAATIKYFEAIGVQTLVCGSCTHVTI